MSELIAEARVLVTPDTTSFRSLLTAQLAAVTKGVTVPVSVTPVVATSATAAQASALAGANALSESTAQLGASTASTSAVRAQFARTEEVIAAAEKRAAVASTEAAAAQTRYNAALVSSAAAQRAYKIALTTTDKALTLQAGLVVAVTQENEALALSQLNVARSAQAESAALNKAAASQAASLGGLAKGGTSAAASLLGVRGATLAATGPFLAGAAGAIAFGRALSIATGFSQQLSVFAATTGATADELDRVSASAQQLGKDLTLPGVSASDAAEAMTEFAKAGLSVNDAIAATRGGLQLATAAQLSNADAVELTANALNAFKLSGDQAVSVADTLANAANAAQGSIADIGLGLKQAAGAAAVVGVSFEDTTALLTLLAKNGLTASDAGTSLRTAFIRLVNPSKAAQKILSDLNVQLRDAQGNVRPEVFAEFAAAQENLSRATQDSNAAIVFGQDAFRAFGVLSREGASGLENVRSELEQTGTAAKIAGARMTGVAGATANLKNQLEALGLVVGQVATPAVEALVNQLAGFVATGADAAKVAISLGKGFAGIGQGIASSIPGAGFADDIFKLTNPLTGVTSPVRQLKEIGDLFGIGSDDAAKTIKASGVTIRDGIEEASREAARGAVSFGDQITGALTDAFSLVDRTVTQAAKNFRAGQFAAVAKAGGQQSGLEEILNQIVAGGGSDQQQIANLRRQAAVQAKVIESAGPDAAGDLLQARRAAQEKLASINQQIVGIETRIASDQKSAQDAAQRVRDQAKADRDRAFLQSQEDARTTQERRVTLAGDTPALTDDIRRQEQLRVLLVRQIAAIKASALDEAAKASALRTLKNARDATIDEIKRLRDTDKRQRQEQAQQNAEALASARLELAQTTFDLTGAKAPLERALDAEIKRQIKIKNAAKKGSVAFLNAQNEIRRLLKQKKDLNEEVTKDAADDSATGGTSLVDLFNKAQDILGGAGNVGFNASSLAGLSARPRIQAEVQQRLDIVNDPAKAAAAKQVASTDRLIIAIDQLTQVLTGNTASGTPVTRREQNTWRNLTQEQRFYNQRTARQMVEQGLVG